LVRFAQWMIGLAVVAASGVATFVLLSPGEADRLRKDNEDKARQIFQFQQAVERLTSEDRVAEVFVIGQVHAGDMVDGKPAPTDLTTLDFTELDREGHPLPSRRITVQGTEPRFESLVIMFKPEFVAMGDALKGKSLALFRGIYGEQQRPVDAVWLDQVGGIPSVYRVNPEPSKFEQDLWKRFWDYARDKALCERDGVELTQGQAVFSPMRKGDKWTISLQHNAGLKLKLRRGGNETELGSENVPASQG
jgi:hypothetical protein